MRRLLVLAMLAGGCRDPDFVGATCTLGGEDQCKKVGLVCRDGQGPPLPICVRPDGGGDVDAATDAGTDGGLDGGYVYPNTEGLYLTADGGSALVCDVTYGYPTTLGNCCNYQERTCELNGGGTCVTPTNSGTQPCCVDLCDAGFADGGPRPCSCLTTGSCYSTNDAGGLGATDANYICPDGMPGW